MYWGVTGKDNEEKYDIIFEVRTKLTAKNWERERERFVAFIWSYLSPKIGYCFGSIHYLKFGLVVGSFKDVTCEWV